MLNFHNNKYLLPGLKRWILLMVTGVMIIAFGIALLMELRPFSIISSFVWNSIRNIASLIPPHISGPIALIIGIGFICAAIWFSIRTTLVATQGGDSAQIGNAAILRSLELSYRRAQGPKIVAIGGGTGLSTLLRGLKSYSKNITAIVTVGDDGGSSGVLREELKVIPPGDIRNCIVALSDEDETLSTLFQYRFSEGSLKGHSLGNLFLAALFDTCDGDIPKSTLLASKVLRSSGCVLPSSQKPLCLSAEYSDGTIIDGESNIPKQNKKINKIFSTGEISPALEESLEAIKDADFILLGPGSLYTSIIPNLLFTEISSAIKESPAKVLYICNLVEDAETTEYKAKDFVESIHQHAGHDFIDAVLVNDPKSYTIENNSKPIKIGKKKLDSKGIEVIIRPKLHDEDGRHNPIRLARSVIHWISQTIKDQNK